MCFDQLTELRYDVPTITNTGNFRDIILGQSLTLVPKKVNVTQQNKLARTGLTVNSSQLTFVPTSKTRETKTRTNIKNPA